jgi:hypothetical protein
MDDIVYKSHYIIVKLMMTKLIPLPNNAGTHHQINRKLVPGTNQ